MNEFKVNEYITLKLEGGDTNIYVKGRKFLQCKHLLLNVPIEQDTAIDSPTYKYLKEKFSVGKAPTN